MLKFVFFLNVITQARSSGLLSFGCLLYVWRESRLSQTAPVCRAKQFYAAVTLCAFQGVRMHLPAVICTKRVHRYL